MNDALTLLLQLYNSHVRWLFSDARLYNNVTIGYVLLITEFICMIIVMFLSDQKGGSGDE